jgi:hypothetical protein
VQTAQEPAHRQTLSLLILHCIVITDTEYHAANAIITETNHQTGDQLQGSPTPSICPGNGKKGHIDHAPVCEIMSKAAWLDHATTIQVRQFLYLK